MKNILNQFTANLLLWSHSVDHLKVFILLVFILTGFNCFSQDKYYPFPVSGGKWHGCSSGGMHVDCVDEYQKIVGDTIYNERQYALIHVEGLMYYSLDDCSDWITGSIDYFVGIRNDSVNKKVYFTHFDDKDTLLYDFDLHIGDTLKKTYLHNEFATVAGIDSVMVSNNFHKRFLLKDTYIGQEIYLIEGVGGTRGLFTEFSSETSCMDRFWLNDTVAYINPHGFCSFTGINHDPGTNHFSIRPNPVMGKYTVFNTNYAAGCDLTITSSVGVSLAKIRVENEDQIDLSAFSPGLYIFILSEKNHFLGSLKVIKVQ